VNTPETYASSVAIDLNTIYTCDFCLSDQRRFAQKCFQPSDNGLLKKHPPIGFGRRLFFVNINPRSTNNIAMEWAMESIDNFKQFAANRRQNHVCIPGSEDFYNIHAAICNSIFSGMPVEEVAIPMRFNRSGKPCGPLRVPYRVKRKPVWRL